MAKRLRREETVTIGVLAEKRQNHCEIARTLGVTEGTVRYQLRRQAEGAEGGRSGARRTTRYPGHVRAAALRLS